MIDRFIRKSIKELREFFFSQDSKILTQRSIKKNSGNELEM